MDVEHIVGWVVSGLVGGAGGAYGIYMKWKLEARKTQSGIDKEDADTAQGVKDKEGKRHSDEVDAAIQRAYAYVDRVEIEREGDRKNMENVRVKFEKLYQDYLIAREELGRERSSNAQLISEKAQMMGELDKVQMELKMLKGEVA